MQIHRKWALLLLILTSPILAATQTINFWVADYEKTACFSSNVLFNTTSTCPSGIDCFYVFNYGDSKTDTVNANISPRHLYSNDGMYDVNITMLRRSDSSEIMNKTFNRAVSVYNPTGASIMYDTLMGGKSYIILYSVADFKPKDSTAWRYTWSFDDMTVVQKDSLTHYIRKEYSEENINPGYLVKLKIEMIETSSSAELINDWESCYDTVSRYVTVLDSYFENPEEPIFSNRKPLLYNVITSDGNPNDANSSNDVFKVTTNGHDVFNLTIFNNYGSVVFTKSGKDVSWTGVTNSGRRVKSGTYYYAVESTAPGDKHRATGFVHVFNEN